MASKKLKKRKGRKTVKRKRLRLFRVLTYVGVFFVVFFGVCLMIVAFYPVESELENNRYVAIVPGASVTRAGNPSPALRMRLDKALSLYNDGRVRKVFISGTSYEVIVMRNYLRDNGVNDSDIIADIEGNNTYRTVINARGYIEDNNVRSGAVFVSQRYHIPRIILLSIRNDLTNAEFLKSEIRNIDSKEKNQFLLRESLAFIKALIFNR